MRKGISGHTLVIVISIIVAMIGLVLFWIFLTHTTESGISFGKEIACKICEAIRGGIGKLLINCPC
jgi:hypothetical protein